MLSVGELLQKQRIRKGYDLAHIEKQIKIRAQFLKAVEENNWNIFSSKIYIVGIIKNYARFLGLEEKKVVAFFRREYEQKDDIHFKKRVSSRYLISDTKKIVRIGLIIICLFFVTYFGFQLFTYLTPPQLLLIEPKQSSFKHIDKIKVIGKTEKEASVHIFGERIYQNKAGFFEYDFPLKQEKNILTIEAVGANGKKTTITKEFFLKQ
ncbi:hypothetical protein COY90_00690 [Candidatus Roizmanbacteria bacterium CG_4_10_14_0_8_um_filter_39_9]|uniref:HTH cro/C1-type domain-containing protein n=1 Tax=Candidatus Roizmanbacteria bacterium CG_4_10_14_0_8_um_filter_39_9 TaxID=1974829 RepID=A0A2M7QDY3_9BACT|nr:MAG: hypothetical protein COY90_00690 [Candidatus Roizmanbacteria bacterium CG_4_10_14_0_8_um_filter_39_9]